MDTVSQILGTYTDPIPDQLLNALKADKCILLAGAGVSQRCLARNRQPLPAWQDLLSSLISWSAYKGIVPSANVKELEDLLKKNQHILVAEELIEKLGLQNVHDFLNDVFDPDGIVPSHLHELLVASPFRFFVTTNYDNLLERAFVSVRNRHIERVSLDELTRLETLLNSSDFIIKLHGDIDRPETIILGQRQYQHLIQTREYSAILDKIFLENSVLMVGYGLNDPDILLTLDRLARISPEQPPHFLLCPRESRTPVEKKRLASDRNVHVIEYVDYFGFHNHIDTFLHGLNTALDNLDLLTRVRPNLRTRIHVHYPIDLVSDGLFVWNFLFREGAITLSEEPQHDQLNYLDRSMEEGLRALDYLLFVVNEKALDEDGEFLPKVKRATALACDRGIQVLFLVVGAERRPLYLARNVYAPTFYVKNGFSEKDLLLLRSYVAQDIRMGRRQP
jgi:hypothetical protein